MDYDVQCIALENSKTGLPINHESPRSKLK
jgi:hypothetical protein